MEKSRYAKLLKRNRQLSRKLKLSRKKFSRKVKKLSTELSKCKKSRQKLKLKRDGKKEPSRCKDAGKKEPSRCKDGGKEDNHPVLFFKKLLKDENVIMDGNLEGMDTNTIDFFTEFFNKFKSINVTINEDEIVKSSFIKPFSDIFNHIHPEIQPTLEKTMTKTFTYVTNVKRQVRIRISTDNDEDENNIKKYLYMIIFWLNVVTQYADDNICTGTLDIMIMLSKLKKTLPSSSPNDYIDKKHINTGFSDKCKHIVIYRKEEWFKVFIHETFHNYSLDFFKNNTNPHIKNMILDFFGIENKFLEVKLFEAYTESWARIMNALIIAFDKEKNKIRKFIKLADENIKIEILNGYFQVCKILKFMNLTMENLKSYNEETSNLSYYFLCSILYSDYQGYLLWLRHNNKKDRILQFDNDNSDEKQIKFVEFIKSKSGPDSIFMKNIKYFTEKFFTRNDKSYLYSYMRKSVLDFPL